MGEFTTQIIHAQGRYLNNCDDPLPGQPLTSPSGSIVVGFDGQLGSKIAVSGLVQGSQSEATSLSLTTTGTLYGGVYQYVQFKSGSTASNAVGQILFWYDVTKFIVTPDVTLSTQGLVAGIGLQSNTKGNYGFVQVSGLASVLFKSSITKATPAIGDLVIVDQGGGTPTNKADILADATNLTSLTAKSIIGMAYGTAPANSTISQVLLDFTRWTN